MAERVLIIILAIAITLAGCLGSSSQGRDDPPPPPPEEVGSKQCDAGVETERIRGREVDLAVDSNDPARMAAGYMASIPSTRDSPPDDEPIWIRVVRSSDGGHSWTGGDLPGWPGSPSVATSPFGGSLVTGDPVMAFLPDGTLLMIGIMIRSDYSYVMFSARFIEDSLEPTDVVILSRGAYGDPALNEVWSPGTVLYNDKEEVAVDPETGTAYASWMWRHNSPNGGVRSIPVVVMSVDGGVTWSDPKTLFGGLGGGLTSDEGHIGQFPFITNDGNAHIVWYAQDRRAMLLATAPVGTVDFGPPREIAGDVRLSTPAAAISIPLPTVAVGPSPGGMGQSAYVAWADSRNGDADVLLIRSDDAGANWSQPVVVGSDAVDHGQEQLVPVLAVSSTGTLGVHYVGFNGSQYDAYAAISADAGTSFDVLRISSQSTRMANATGQRGTGIQGHVGDYFGAAFSGPTMVSMWQDGRQGSADEPFTAIFACRL